MHPDAEENYSTPRPITNGGGLPPIADMTDEQVVLELWGNSRYRQMTGGDPRDAPPRLHELWRDVNFAPPGARRAEAFAALRRRVEEHGWHRDAPQAGE